MSEPVITPAAAATAGVTISGVSAAVASALGIDVTTICWALAGGWFGSSFAPKVGPIKTVVQFLAASLISALGATVAADWWQLKPGYMHLLAASLSSSFYALKRAILARVGLALDRVLDRIWPAAPKD